MGRGTGELALGGPLEGHRAGVNLVAFSLDGTMIASGSGDHTVRVWDAATGEALGGPLEGHGNTVTSVAWSPDGTTIASGELRQDGASVGRGDGRGGARRTAGRAQ